MQPIEERLGHEFADPRLLQEALTHPSVAYESHGPRFDNQRLEFLGDAVLQLALTEELFRRFPEKDEGFLTKTRARLVSRAALTRFAKALRIGEALVVGRGEESTGGRSRPSTLADAFEAVIGAVYLDAGFEAARNLIHRHCNGEIAAAAASPEEENPKGTLQEILQAASNQSPSYDIVSHSGPAHSKTFRAKVEWGTEILGTGEGPSKKVAECAAARAALTHPTVRRIARATK
ncbi:MAG: ribonuclease III [Verrucomicrobiales bacterium]